MIQFHCTGTLVLSRGKTRQATTLRLGLQCRRDEGWRLCTRKLRCVAVGCRTTPQNKLTVGRMRDLCETTSLLHAGPSGVRALLSEAYLTTPARAADWALPHPYETSQMIQTQEIIAYRRSFLTTDSVMTPPLYILRTSFCKTRGSLLSVCLLVYNSIRGTGSPTLPCPPRKTILCTGRAPPRRANAHLGSAHARNIEDV